MTYNHRNILFIQVTFYLIVIPSMVLAILLFVILCIIAWINTPNEEELGYNHKNILFIYVF